MKIWWILLCRFWYLCVLTHGYSDICAGRLLFPWPHWLLMSAGSSPKREKMYRLDSITFNPVRYWWGQIGPWIGIFKKKIKRKNSHIVGSSSRNNARKWPVSGSATADPHILQWGPVSKISIFNSQNDFFKFQIFLKKFFYPFRWPDGLRHYPIYLFHKLFSWECPFKTVQRFSRYLWHQLYWKTRIRNLLDVGREKRLKF
jgi:hypothetical protein